MTDSNNSLHTKGIQCQRGMYKEHRFCSANWSQVLLQPLSLAGCYGRMLQQTVHASGPLQVRASRRLGISKEYGGVLSQTRVLIRFQGMFIKSVIVNTVYSGTCLLRHLYNPEFSRSEIMSILLYISTFLIRRILLSERMLDSAGSTVHAYLCDLIA